MFVAVRSAMRAMARCFVLLAFASPAISWAQSNRAPQFTSVPEAVVHLGREYVYQARATDPDNDAVVFETVNSPPGATLDAASGRFAWLARADQVGSHAVTLRARDARGASTDQRFTLRVVEDFCQIYPIALPSQLIATLQPGARVAQMPRGTGAGNYSWLTWTGAVDAPTLAQSLLPPGDSDTYVNPDRNADRRLDIGDWAQGATGSMNARDVRDHLDALLQQDIVLPVWDRTRGQGNNFDYRVARFVVVRLTGYELTGQGWIGFEYRGEAHCYNAPPVARDLDLRTPEDTAVEMRLPASDPDGDALTFEIVAAPSHGRLSGTGADRTYTPNLDFNGVDTFTFRVSDGNDGSSPATVRITVTPVNDAPVAHAATYVTDEDVALPVLLAGSDGDSSQLSYRLETNPAHGTLEGEPPQLTYLPSPGFFGEDALRFVVSDGQRDSAPATVRITVRPVNDPPRITSLPPLAVEIAKPYSYPAAAIDPDVGDVLSWTLLAAPSGMSIDAATGVITWTPTTAQLGTHAIELKVSDVAGASDTQRYELALLRDNAPPQIVSPPVELAVEGEAYTYDVEARDPDDDPLRYALTRSPEGMQIALANGEIAWTAPASLSRGHLDSHRFCQRPIQAAGGLVNDSVDFITVVDRSGSMGTELAWIPGLIPTLETSLRLRGVGVNRANRYGLVDFDYFPRALDLGGSRWGGHAAFSQAAYRLKANDEATGREDGYLAIHYSLANYPYRDGVARNLLFVTDEGRTAVDPTLTRDSILQELLSHRVVLNAALNVVITCADGRNALGLGQNGVGYVADGQGGYTQCANPTVKNGPPADPREPLDLVGHYVSLALESGGAVWDLNYLRDGGLASESFSRALIEVKVREIVGQIGYAPLADLVPSAIRFIDSNGSEPAQAQITVRNRGLVAAAATTLQLDAESASGALSLGNQAVPGLLAGAEITLAFALPQSIDASDTLRARIEGIGPADCHADNDSLRAPLVRVTATDPFGLSDAQTYAITVAERNDAPVFDSTPNLRVDVGRRYVYRAIARDPDRGDGVGYRLAQAPLDMSIDELSGELSFKPNAGQIGSHPVRIVARDLRGLEVAQAFTLVVNAGTPPPRIVSTAAPRAIQGTLWIYAPVAENVAGATFVLFDGPAGMAVDAATGQLHWNVPTTMPSGTLVWVLLAVTREDGTNHTQVFEVFVDSPNAAPVITTTPGIEAFVRSSYNYVPRFTDSNFRDTIAWSILHGPSTMTMDANSGFLEWNYLNTAADFPETMDVSDPYCREPAAVGASLAPRQDWTWSGATYPGAPIIARLRDSNADGDVDADDAPSLVVVGTLASPAGNRVGLAVLDAATGVLQWKATGRTLVNDVAPAAADIDGDGDLEILAITADQRVVAFDASGAERWVSAPVLTMALNSSALAAADLDSNGSMEVLIGGDVYNGDGSLRWRFALEPRPLIQHLGTALAVDTEGDARPELYFMDQVRDSAGNLLRRLPMPNRTQYVRWSAGNLDRDPALELVAIAKLDPAAAVLAFDTDGTPLFGARPIPVLGQSVIADFDGDGANEIFVSGNDRFFKADGSERLSSFANPGGYPAFATDLDRDGALELVRASGGHLFILSPGGERISSVSGFGAQAPVLGRVGDEGWLFANSHTTVASFRATGGAWAPPSEDPSQQTSAPVRNASPGSPPAGSFNLVTAVGDGSTLRPDLWIGNLKLIQSESGNEIELEVKNRGLAAVMQSVTLRVHSGAPQQGGLLLHESTLASLGAGSSRMVRFALSDLSVLRDQIHAEIDPQHAVAECEVRNNRNTARYVVVRASDHGGLSDTQRFILQVRYQNTIPAFTSAPLLTAVEFVPYEYDVQVTDPDIGERHHFGMSNAPAGATIDRVSGLIRWTPRRGQAGTQRFVVSVTDLEATTRFQTFDVRVSAAPNTDPRFVSAPLVEARMGRAYQYDADAADDQGDPITYSLESPPVGMTVVATTGVVSWTPTSVGDVAVALVAKDDHGGRGTQSFTLRTIEDRSPVITSEPPTFGRVDRTYVYAVLASDPDHDPLSYQLGRAPAGMSVDAVGRITWTPGADQIGSHAVTVQVSDGRTPVTVSWTIDVAAQDALAQILIRIDPTTPSPAQPIALTVRAEIRGPISVLLDGLPVVLDAAGHATLPPQAPGSHSLVASVDDGGTPSVRTLDFVVADPHGAAPQVRLLTPLPHADYDTTEITAPTPVTGTVTDTDLARWELMAQDLNGGPILVLASGTQAFTAQTLASFDPTRLLNGQYQLVLQAWDAAGHHGVDVRVLSVTGDLKLGHYSITFEEASIPVAGIPVTVTRTYDTRRRLENGDFGYGWTVDASNVRVHESRRLGFGWQMHRLEQGLLDTYCLLPNGDPIVTVTLPDGQVESFKAKALPECGVTPRVDVTVVFEPIAGTDSTLRSASYGTVRFSGSNLVDLSDPQLRPIDPGGYTLTTAEGVAYRIDQAAGLQQVSEPNGTSLTYTRDGVRHSSGIGIDFVRDAQGRITQLKLPDQTTIDYAYDAAGDLIGLTDTGGEPASFGYHTRYAHYLESITDARGVMVSRNEYDEQGKLVATIDAEGRRIEFRHDIDGRTAQVKDRRGHVTHYIYNDRGDVLSETNALDETITHTYDEDGQELSRTDALERTTRWVYDARGNVLTETNPAGETTTSTYNLKNQLLTQRDAAGRLVMENAYAYHDLNLISTKDALGHETRFRYDFDIGGSNTGQVRSIVDAAGGATVIDYAASLHGGYKIGETDALGHRTTFVNDGLGRVTEERRTRTKADGTTETLVTAYTYDDKGRVTSTTHPDGSVTTTEYDGLDSPSKECDALQRCTEYVYNARGEQTEVRYPDGAVESKTYDPNGNLLTQTDRGGRTATFVYDVANRLVETIHPDADRDDGNDANNPRSRNIYDAAGQLTESVDENGRSTKYVYDTAGRRTQTILTAVVGAAEAAIITDTYDNAGRRVSTTDADGHRTDYRYDAAGRLTETIHADATPGNLSDNPRTRTDYDALGRKTAQTDENGRVTRFAYDKLSRLIAVVLPHPVTGANPPLLDAASPESGALTTRYTYDEVGNKLIQTDAEGRTTRWEYDRMGRELARILPDGQRETKRYNVAGELIESTDFNGQTTRYRYDGVGRADQIDYPNDADVGFGYNAVSERTTVTDGRGTSTTQFDRRGRVVQARDADGGLIEYQYDDAGNLLARISPSQSLAYTYDERHRMVAVTRTVDGEAPMTTRYTYDQDGNRKAMLGGDGIRTEYTYDRRHRLTNLVKKTATGALLLAMQYTVDASGMRTAVAEQDGVGPVRAVAYTYDPVNRLTREAIDHRDANKDRNTAWTYDDVGNRLSQTLTTGGLTETTTYAYDANDRLLSEARSGGAGAGSTAYTYDANGNTRTKTGQAGTTTYRYNDANRLIEAITPQGTTAYVYTADGLRVRQTHTPLTGTATTTWYVQDTAYPYAQVIEEYTSTGTGPKQLAATFTFADDLVSQTRYDASGNLTTRFVQQDGFGSTRWLTDATGVITDTINYDAFGNEIDRTGTTEIEHLYRSEQFDPNLGFYYLRARFYAPSSGRFVTQDTYMGDGADPASLHKYAYANSNPANGVDPSGNMTLMDLSFSQIQTAMRTVGSMGARQFIKQAVTGTMRVARIALNEAKNCFRNPSKCKLKIPILAVGSETPETAQHILDAQLGGGSNIINSPFWLTRKSPPHSRSWIRRDRACAGKVRGITSCDEYPFASTVEGGAMNASRVSLRPVPVWEQSLQGGILSAFYSACRISKTSTSANPLTDKRTFMVLPTPGSIGFPLCLR